jgi:DNA-binding LacI/PurR family transcriptional regulator
MSKRLTPSSRDVAALAGVSQAAVSRAFSPDASISGATRERVMNAAKTLGYRPNLLARSLITGRSGIIGIVMGNPKNPSFIAALQSLSARLSKAGKHILIFTAEDADCAADVHVEDLLWYQVDALLLISANLSSRLAGQCAAAGIPVIYLNRLRRRTDGTVSVSGDHVSGARAIAAHLIEQGYRRLSYMVGFRDSLTNQERESAFCAQVAKEGLPEPKLLQGHFQRDGAMQAARSALSAPDRPDAIFCASDYMAMATIEVARHEFGLQIGRDLGVAGFDDIDQAAWPSFDLTTYSQPVEAMMDTVTNILLHGRAGEHPSRIIVPGELKRRGSTRRN